MAKRRGGSKSQELTPLTPGGVAAVEQLATRWLKARPSGGGLAAALTAVAVPPGLAETVTKDPRVRSQTLDDASWWLAAPTASGVGLEIFLLNADELALGPRGDRQLQPARFALSWVDGSDPASQAVTREEVFASLVHEQGQWRVRSLWSKAERREVEAQRKTLRGLLETLPQA